MQNATANRTDSQTVTLRSRHARYRWRDIQFEHNIAKVTEAQAEAARRDPSFGQGRDFWRDVTPAAVAVPEVTDPPLTLAGLNGMTKKELVAIAAERSIEIDAKGKNADIVETIALDLGLTEPAE